jgi:phage FluMu gp28-like protein
MIPITKMNYFITKLPKGLFHKPQKTFVHLKNGSTILALPNNPNNLRGFTLNIVYCDEMNFIPNDEEMYDAISFTLATTNGKFIASSTPGRTESTFWKIFHEKAFEHFAKTHVTYQQVLEQKGPITKEWLEKKRKEYEGDPWRWRREMLADWAEDENVWLPLALITNCIDHALEYAGFEDLAKGEFYAGLDLGKYQDYSVFTVVKIEESSIKLIHMHQFQLRTPYASVIGYVKTIRDRWQKISKVLVDMSGVGDYIVEDMRNAGISETEGVKFTQETKEQLATFLKQCMIEKRLKIPYDPELIAELNIERFELTKEGKAKFSHPEGTHDDRFWSLALAVYATRKEQAPKAWIIPRTAKGKLQKIRDRLRKHNVAGVTR